MRRFASVVLPTLALFLMMSVSAPKAGAEPTAEQQANVVATEQAYDAVVAKQAVAKQAVAEVQTKAKAAAPVK